MRCGTSAARQKRCAPESAKEEHMELETKALETRDAAQSREIKEAFGEFLRVFEGFKEANDERLAQIEKRSADIVTEEKVERINKALDTQKRTLDELML